MSWYTRIKQAAKEQGLRVEDCIALARQNDPFYVGTKGDLDKAHWFGRLWERFGYTTGVHLRRVHYRLVSADPPILKPNGKPYENTEADWGYLLAASKCARYTGAVEPAAFVDRRNPAPIVNAEYWCRTKPDYLVTGQWDGFEIEPPKFPHAPGFHVTGYTDGNLQPYHLEVWVEKTTMNDVLEPLCRQYGVNLVTGAGELSITAALALVNRAVDAERPVRIFYVSDFDPAGYGMPVSVARKIEYFLREAYGSWGAYDHDVRLEPIVLTAQQVEEYGLPRTPIKATERRKGRFEYVHGEGAVELDALEALHPGELRSIVEEHISRYYDWDIAAEAEKVKEKLEEALMKARGAALSDLWPVVGDLRDEFDRARDQFVEAVEAVQESLPQLYEEIRERLGEVEIDLDDYEVPAGEEAVEDGEVLFDSTRGYSPQLASYKRYQYGIE